MYVYVCLVTIFDELFRSEGVQQVYAIVTEWLEDLEDSERIKIKSDFPLYTYIFVI